MTKKFFKSFKNRFGEVTMIYFSDPLEEHYIRWNHRLDLGSNNIHVERVD